MAYLHQPWFNREIVNRFTMATGAVHSQTLTVMKRFSKRPQKIPITPVEVDGVKATAQTPWPFEDQRVVIHPKGIHRTTLQ